MEILIESNWINNVVFNKWYRKTNEIHKKKKFWFQISNLQTKRVDLPVNIEIWNLIDCSVNAITAETHECIANWQRHFTTYTEIWNSNRCESFCISMVIHAIDVDEMKNIHWNWNWNWKPLECVSGIKSSQSLIR